jgi:hypothetical protein
MEKIQLLPLKAGTFFRTEASNELPDDYAFLVATPCGKKGHNTAGFSCNATKLHTLHIRHRPS